MSPEAKLHKLVPKLRDGRQEGGVQVGECLQGIEMLNGHFKINAESQTK